MRNEKIFVFYRGSQVLKVPSDSNYSKSPQKPRLLLRYLIKNGLGNNFKLMKNWKPFEIDDFRLAHTDEYVDGFFEGKSPVCTRNGLEWSPQFADSVRYTNASLYNAIKHACENPETITFSPTSGFHHARPDGGSGFCTFSGQVIASIKIYREKRMAGAYIDLDGHYGNSIEDSREFAPEINQAVPEGCNINPGWSHERYLNELGEELAKLEKKLVEGSIGYVVFCHGADSHEWDQLGNQCSTGEWIRASEMVYQMIERAGEKLGRPIPLTLALFGGYRDDDYESVLSLHTADLTKCLDILCGRKINYQPKVIKRKRS